MSEYFPRRPAVAAVVLAALVLLAACTGGPPAPRSTGPGVVTVELDRSAYALGDSARATITNRGKSLVRFAFGCDGFVEGWTGGGWGTVYEPDCSNLRVRPTELGAGEQAAWGFPMEPCPAGALTRYAEFRIRLRYQLPDGRDQVAHSAPFSVHP